MVYFILYHIKFKYFDRIYWRALEKRGKGRESCSWAKGRAEHG